MEALCNGCHFSPIPPFSPLVSAFKLSFSLSPNISSLKLKSINHHFPARRRWVRSSAADYDVDMVANKQGIYTPKQSKVVVLWDLDNKPPRGPPYTAAMALKKVAEKFGEVVDISAYANRHAFIHLPMWVVDERRERRQVEILERKGLLTPSEPYLCKVCGRKCKTSLDLKKHFKQLHERERQKKLNRMRSLRGKKRQKYKERFISGNEKYNEASRELVTPKMGYGLGAELRRAGVFVKMVEDKPQAADWAVKRQMQHSMSRGIDWIFLVSDDSDFSDMLRKAREAKLGTVVVGDRDRALGRHADLWVSWNEVEMGEITEKDLVGKSRRRRDDGFVENEEDGFTVTYSADDANDLNGVLDEFSFQFNGATRISAFSEGEEEEDDDYLFWDSDEDDAEDYSD